MVDRFESPCPRKDEQVAQIPRKWPVDHGDCGEDGIERARLAKVKMITDAYAYKWFLGLLASLSGSP